MEVTACDILDAGLLANGKFPDIYWDLDITGSELKIIRYVFSNCLRLHQSLEHILPKGSDGSVRFWRGKERMAKDCGMSAPTFRNGIRHLAELGVVTSMDSDDADDDCLYSVGLSAEFINIKQTEKSFRLHLLPLIHILYDNLTVELIENQLQTSGKLPSDTNVSELQDAVDQCKNTERDKDSSPYESIEEQNKIKDSSIAHNSHSSLEDTTSSCLPVRTPIRQVKRTPIFLLPQNMRLASAQKKLRMLSHIKTPYERKVLQMVEYYEYRCRQAIRSSGFRALGRDFRNHKNWKLFTRLYDLCVANDWDYKVYIDAQFDRIQYWERKQPYPYPNQFTSEGAVNYYHGYMRDYAQKHSLTGDAKAKGQKIKTVNQQIIDDVISDCESISAYLSRAPKRKATADLTPEQAKIVYLSDHWMGLSVSYLASIPWFERYLDQFPDETFLVDLKQEIQAIRRSPKMSGLVNDIVMRIEREYNIPATPT